MEGTADASVTLKAAAGGAGARVDSALLSSGLPWRHGLPGLPSEHRAAGVSGSRCVRPPGAPLHVLLHVAGAVLRGALLPGRGSHSYTMDSLNIRQHWALGHPGRQRPVQESKGWLADKRGAAPATPTELEPRPAARQPQGLTR